MWPNDVRKSDLRIEYMRGSGKGGQHRNKRDTACRITHLPTGFAARAEDGKSRAQNQKKAFLRLAAKLRPLMVSTQERKVNTKVVRNYHEPDQRVQDKRIKDRRWSYDAVIHGKALDEIILEVGRQNGSSRASDDR